MYLNVLAKVNVPLELPWLAGLVVTAVGYLVLTSSNAAQEEFFTFGSQTTPPTSRRSAGAPVRCGARTGADDRTVSRRESWAASSAQKPRVGSWRGNLKA